MRGTGYVCISCARSVGDIQQNGWQTTAICLPVALNTMVLQMQHSRLKPFPSSTFLLRRSKRATTGEGARDLANKTNSNAGCRVPEARLPKSGARRNFRLQMCLRSNARTPSLPLCADGRSMAPSKKSLRGVILLPSHSYEYRSRCTCCGSLAHGSTRCGKNDIEQKSRQL